MSFINIIGLNESSELPNIVFLSANQLKFRVSERIRESVPEYEVVEGGASGGICKVGVGATAVREELAAVEEVARVA